MEVRSEGTVGRPPWRAGVREATGCQVVAVRRGDTVQVEFGPDFEIAADDVLYICGAREATDEYFVAHPGARPQVQTSGPEH